MARSLEATRFKVGVCTLPTESNGPLPTLIFLRAAKVKALVAFMPISQSAWDLASAASFMPLKFSLGFKFERASFTEASSFAEDQ